MKTTIIPSVQKAIDFVKSNITNGVWKNGDAKLPSCKELAAQAGIGYVGMVTAIKILQKEKVITARRNVGIYAGQQIPLQNIPESSGIRTYKWQTIREKLKYDILEGRFHENEFLPGFKTLIEIYETSFPVLKDALVSLVKEDLIVVGKRRYRIRRYTARKSLNAICFVSNKRSISLSLWHSEEAQLELVARSLEKECLVRNITLSRSLLQNKSPIAPDTLNNTLGFVFWFIWGNDFVHSEDELQLVEMVKNLVVYKKPIVIISNNGFYNPEIMPQLIDLASHHTNLYIIQHYNNENAGYHLGRFLIDKGYKKACYFCPSYAEWPIDRLNGLIKAFKSMGLQDAVVPFMVSKEEMYNATPPCADPDDVRITKEINEKYDFLNSFALQVYKRKEMPSYGDFEYRFLASIYETHNGFLFRRAFQPLFREALKIKGRIAWVCADDYLANYAALQFLKDENIKIPDLIGIVGFNDQVESLVNGITSYNFNFTGMAVRALNFILHPNDKQWKKDRKDSPVVSIKGMVIDRGSV